MAVQFTRCSGRPRQERSARTGGLCAKIMTTVDFGDRLEPSSSQFLPGPDGQSPNRPGPKEQQ
jgi:hypothetical protein